jgi:hypothetical protein
MRKTAIIALGLAMSSVAFGDGPNGTVKVDSTGKGTADPPKDPNGPIHWDPVRWQAPDGSTVTFQIDAKTGAMPVLTISVDENSMEMELKDSFREMVPAFVMADADVVITTGATPGVAWRYAVKKGTIVQTKQVYWATDKKRPAWAVNDPPKDATTALKRIASLLRFGNTAPGLQKFFTDTPVAWDVYTRGDKKPWKRQMAGKDTLAKWVGAGFPVLRGKLKIAKGCMTLAANADGKPAAPMAPPDAPHLLKLCVDKDLHVSTIETLIAKNAKDSSETVVTP